MAVMYSEKPDERLAPPETHAAVSPLAGAPEPWTLLDLLFFATFSIAAFILCAVGTLAAYAALRPVMGWSMPARALAQNTFFLLGAQAAAYALIFGYVYVLVVFHYRMKFKEGMRWGHVTGRSIGRFVAAGIAMTIAVQLASALFPDKTNFPLEKLFSSPGASYALAAFAVLIAPFMEELVFRGVLFSVFEARAGMPFAVLATAALFGALHIPEYSGAWVHVVFIFGVGLVLSITRGATRSLAPCVVMHVTYNGILMIALFFASSHFRVIQSLSK